MPGRIALCLSLAIATLTPVAAQQERPQPADGLASAVIAGQIVSADSGAPIRGAQVRLRARTGPDTRIVTTDDRGQFEARNLFAGAWLITVAKNGFITTRYGQRRSSDEGTPVNVSARQRVTIALGLQRAGAINGRVFDEFGEPLLGARVQAWRSRMVRGVRQLGPVGASDSTDDTGSFRLFGLAPGTYYVSAALRAAAPDTDNLQGTIGALTYHPGTADISFAEAIVLRGSEESTIAFQVAPVRNVRLSGIVLGATGAPAADTDVRLVRLDGTQVGTTVGNFGRSGPDGAFSVINVPPGAYVLWATHAAAPTPQRPDPNRMFEETMTPITVGGDDIGGITLAMGYGSTINGTVVAEAGTTLPSPLRLEIAATPVVNLGGGAKVIQISRTAGEPATFQMPGLFGSTTLSVDVPDGLMLAAIEANGVDVTDRPLDLRSSLDVRIVLTTRVSGVSGVVRNGRSLMANVPVIVFPENTDQWKYPNRRIAVADTDEQGRFVVRQLPPDERYLAAVATAFDDGDQFDPEFLRTLRERATSFTLKEGERKVLTLER